MANRRVVITGMGAVTPLGNTVEETWAGIKRTILQLPQRK